MRGKRKRDASSADDAGPSSSIVNYTGYQTLAQSRYRAALLKSRARKRGMVCRLLTNVVADRTPTSSSALMNPELPSPVYMDLGECSNICEFCGALFWFAERSLSSSLKHSPKYTICCRGGRVRLQFPFQPPEVMKDLFADSRFLKNIRAYNSMFSMTSFGAHIDETVNKSAGPYVFKVAGRISHWIGSLCPPGDEAPRFLQMYIFDSSNEVSNRLRFFSDGDATQLSADSVDVLANTLAEVNEYVKLFKCARELCSQTKIPDFSIKLHSRVKQTSYDNPAVGTLGAIVCDNDFTTTCGTNDFDIVVRSKDGTPHRVSKLHPSYMPLQYPLLFPYGEQGWSPDLWLTSEPLTRDRRIMMNMFYSFQIHDRDGVYTQLLRAGRLFQQYLVDAFICVEQSRLDYIHANQNLFRTEFLHGIHDALSRGDTEGYEVGKRIILPASFTGSPRYMYKHYQDALCYAMTINKSQGQSLNKVGVYFPEPIFGHGQLYVALSRAMSPNALKVLIKPQEDGSANTTLNIVFSDLLNEIEAHEIKLLRQHCGNSSQHTQVDLIEELQRLQNFKP